MSPEMATWTERPAPSSVRTDVLTGIDLPSARDLLPLEDDAGLTLS